MSAAVVTTSLLVAMVIVLVNQSRRTRALIAAIALALGGIVLFVLPSGGADNGVPFLIALACAAVVAGAAVSEAVAFVYSKLVKSVAHG